MFTVRIETKSTRLFSWHSSSSRSLHEHGASSLHEAVVEGITDFHAYVQGPGSQDGLCACLVTWEDGPNLYAFIFPKDGQIPTASTFPWIQMRTQPERVKRSSPG